MRERLPEENLGVDYRKFHMRSPLGPGSSLPDFSGGPTGSPGSPDNPLEGLFSPEMVGTPEAIRNRQELYTVPGADFIIEFNNAMATGEIGKIKTAVENGYGYIDGLMYGNDADDYDLDDRDSATELKEKFISVQESIDRPSGGKQGHVYLAIREGLTSAARQARKYEKLSNAEKARRLDEYAGQTRQVLQMRSRFAQAQGQPGLNDAEIEVTVMQERQKRETTLNGWVSNIKDLKRLKAHGESRLSFDQAFIIRQQTCTNEGTQVTEVGNREALKPDKGNFVAYFQMNRVNGERVNGKEMSKWGSAVDKTMAAILDVASGDVLVHGRKMQDIYTDGFASASEFQDWLEAILPFTEIDGVQRMDVLWNAWKMVIWTEEISRVAWKVDSNGKASFANPPYGSDLNTKLIHNDKARATELGWTLLLNENQIVDLDEWTILDKKTRKFVRAMTEDDFERYIAYQKKNPTDVLVAVSHGGHPLNVGRIRRLVDSFLHTAKAGNTLVYDVWRKHKVSLADPDFPWDAVADSLKDYGDIGEVSSGSVGVWMLSQMRGSGVRKLIRGIPEPKDLTRQFYEGLRDWNKLRLLRKGDVKKQGQVLGMGGKETVPENPIAWWAASVLYYIGRHKADQFEKGDPRAHRYFGMAGKFAKGLPGDGALEPTDGDFIANLLAVKAISMDEAKWLFNNFTTYSWEIVRPKLEKVA